ncbi:methionine adenosyltransferase [Bacillus cereus group sp. N21]|nr:methionine adenosyltransferase [Bacillus cereus group sp. N21]
MTKIKKTIFQLQNSNDYDIESIPYELVERKGVGHPDTMCDAIAERASRYYSKYCVEKFGRVAHHWFDKVMLLGGDADVNYGKGELVKPYQVIFAGKGAYLFGNQKIPLEEILFQAAADVLSEVTTGFEPKKHLVIDCRIVDHQGAGRKNSRYRPMTLDEMIEIGDKRLVSNDCNLLHAHAPLSRLEKLVLYTEQYINGSDFKGDNPDTGWDVKIFGSRQGEHFNLIVNMPFLAKDIHNLDQYFNRKAECQEQIATFIENTLGLKPELMLNATDRNGRPYLTALGSVADTGDVGVVGRGNRLNGLITPMRSMSIEAPAGKNPLDHTGKLYGVLTQKIADKIYEEIGKSVEVHIFTSKEAPLDNPDEITVNIPNWDENLGEKEKIEKIVNDFINSVDKITHELIFHGITMW